MLKCYLQNNAERIDYKQHLKMGLMIVKLSASGDPWGLSKALTGSLSLNATGRNVLIARGANAVISFRAAYLSDSDSFDEVFSRRTA